MKKLLVLSLAASTALTASGFRIPEVSAEAVALSAACVANASGADASYYNPAKMVDNENRDLVDAGLTYIHLPAIRFQGSGAMAGISSDSEKENFVVPNIHYTSPKLANDMRFGLSIVVPAGLSKCWKTQPGVSTSEEFTLETVEVNPTIAMPINNRFSIGAGVRMVHSSGVVKATPAAGVVSQDMEGDSLDFGYNLALNYKATDAMNLALTYRSKVDMTVEGDATLLYLLGPVVNGSFSADVEVPIPATLNLAVAHTVGSTTVELDYERVFWSEYENLDFNFNDATAEAVFGTVKAKNWSDSDTVRLGITHEYNDQWTAMAAVAYDETPVPGSTLGFDLPDSDAWVYSIGATYQLDDRMSITGAALTSVKDERTVSNAGVQGEFSDAGAYLVSLGLEYKF